MANALALVKKHFGPNAVILHTRSFRQGGFLGFHRRPVVEITARPAEKAAGVMPGAAKASGFTPEIPAPRRTPPNAARLRRAYGDESLPQVPVTRMPAGMAALETRPGDDPLSSELKKEMANVRNLVENLVREQRRLHAPRMPDQLFDMYLHLIQREVVDEVARDMIELTQRELTGNQMLSPYVVRKRLVEVMDQMLSTAGPVSPNLDGTPRVVALIGPTGVGKTTTIAKLAASFKLHQNKRVGLITIDTYRIGAVDQLRMYARIIDVPLQVVLTPEELVEAVRSMQDMDYILIDTAGRSQNDDLKMKELKTFLDAAKPHEIHLVLSTTGHQSHMVSAAEKFKSLGVTRLILTKLDEAVSFGVLLSVLKKIDASISYVTTGQDVPDDIEVGDGRKLAQLVLGLPAADESNLQSMLA
jgi:flagellar biosynthesis protein FlhF